MRATYILRKVDGLGRITIPVWVRRNMDINVDDGLEIFTDGDYIILSKYKPTCLFCESPDNITEFNGKKVCEECLCRVKNGEEENADTTY